MTSDEEFPDLDVNVDDHDLLLFRHFMHTETIYMQ